SPADAEVAARRKLGNPTLIREEVYRMNTLTFLEGVCRDLRHALRTLRLKPAFSIPALLSLALGIGANIAIFSVVNGVLIRPLPYPQPDDLAGVYASTVFHGQAFPSTPLSLGMFAAFEGASQTFQEFGVWTAGAATLTGAADPEQIATVTMTRGVFPALGVRPYLGRWFTRDDETETAQATVILS